MIPAPGVRIVTTAAAAIGIATPIDLTNRVLRFTFEDRDDAVDKVTVQLANPDLVLLERRDVLGGAVWQVSWGTEGAMTRPRTMTVRTVRGVEVLTVEGHARHVAMDQVARSRAFHGMTRAAVMRQVAAEHGFQGPFAQITDTEEAFESILQVAETDARFLRRLAQREDFTFALDEDRLTIGPASSLAAPVRVFQWRPGTSDGDVLSLGVESNLALVVGQVVLRGRDPREKRTVTATATRTADEQAGMQQWFDSVSAETGHTRLEQRGALARTVLQPTPVPSARAVDRQATARLRQLDADAVTLTLQVLGDPTLRPRQVVELRGASARLSGRYLVRTAKHQLSADGYTTELALRRRVGAEGAQVGAGAPARPGTGSTATAPGTPARPPSPFDLVDPETGHTRARER